MNNNVVAIILTFLSFFLIFLDVEASKLVLFFIVCLLSSLIIMNSNKLKEKTRVFEKEAEEIRKKLEEKNVNSVEKEATAEDKYKEKIRELECSKDSLERMIRETKRDLERKTQQFEEKIEELEQFSSIFVDRENKMIELKNRIKELENNK